VGRMASTTRTCVGIPSSCTKTMATTSRRSLCCSAFYQRATSFRCRFVRSLPPTSSLCLRTLGFGFVTAAAFKLRFRAVLRAIWGLGGYRGGTC
jgi:hypothetical protein